VTALQKKTLLLGLGNPLSGDDGFGPCVLERLAQRGIGPAPNLTFIDAGTDLLNYIESFVDYDHVVLIDAVLDPEGKLGLPGRVEILAEESFLSWSDKSQGAHQISPLLGVKLFRTLHPEARVQFHLVGLFVDQLSHYPIYLTDEIIEEAVTAIIKFCSTL
jgi:hydrogenase maturation protease